MQRNSSYQLWPDLSHLARSVRELGWNIFANISHKFEFFLNVIFFTGPIFAKENYIYIFFTKIPFSYHLKGRGEGEDEVIFLYHNPKAKSEV